ncbi:MAG: RsmD family RNA methyltransferase, partial [Rhizobiaceae bacterium]
ESAEGRGLIRTNIEALGLTGRTKVFRRDATRIGEIGTLQPFGLVFADPPYGKGLGEKALQSVREGGWLQPNALCVVEETAAAPFEPGAGFSVIEARDYGDTVIRLIEAA